MGLADMRARPSGASISRAATAEAGRRPEAHGADGRWPSFFLLFFPFPPFLFLFIFVLKFKRYGRATSRRVPSFESVARLSHVPEVWELPEATGDRATWLAVCFFRHPVLRWGSVVATFGSSFWFFLAAFFALACFSLHCYWQAALSNSSRSASILNFFMVACVYS